MKSEEIRRLEAIKCEFCDTIRPRKQFSKYALLKPDKPKCNQCRYRWYVNKHKDAIERNCLRCEKKFISIQKNRICFPCKNDEEWREGNDF